MASEDKNKKKSKKTAGPFEALRTLKEELAKADRPAPKSAPKKPAPPPPTREPQGPEEDALLFHRLFAGAEPLQRKHERVSKQLPKELSGRSAAVERVASRGQQAQQAENDAVHERLRVLVQGDARFEIVDDGRRVEGRRDDVSVEAVRRLRRGQLPVDARLDLHGLRVDEARSTLADFLRTMHERGERCVLVIHGKGDHSPLGVGVLRGEVVAWLSQGPSSRHVAAFVTARAEDGGEGAVYVLLRR